MSDFQTPGKHKVTVFFGGGVVVVEGHAHFYPKVKPVFVAYHAFDRVISRADLLAITPKHLGGSADDFPQLPYFPLSHSRN